MTLLLLDSNANPALEFTTNLFMVYSFIFFFCYRAYASVGRQIYIVLLSLVKELIVDTIVSLADSLKDF